MTRLRIKESISRTVFISCATYKRKRIFNNHTRASLFIEILHSCSGNHGAEIITYCIMPDHYHLIIKFKGVYSLSTFLHSLHSFTANQLHSLRKYPVHGRIWNRAWDKWIRSESMLWQKISYVLLNPWRADLVAEPLSDYRYSDIAKWKREKGDDFLRDLFSEATR
ncbi:MAG: transposase [Patescibacteria group bacterium]